MIKLEKTFWWDRNEKFDAQQREIKGGKIVPIDKRLSSKAVQRISTMIRFFNKENKGFNFNIYIDGVESESGFYFTLPWLAHIHICCSWDYGEFGKRWKTLQENDLQKSWGIYSNRDFFLLKWGYVAEDWISNTKSKGFRFSKDWVDLIRGKCKGIRWSKSEKVLDVTIPVMTSYKLDHYPETVKRTDTSRMLDEMGKMHGKPSKAVNEIYKGPAHIDVPMTVYKVIGTWKYSRWFNVKRTIYHVSSGVGIIVPGKGENSWDQDDEIWQSFYHSDRDECDFSTGGVKTPKEAALAYKNTIEYRLNR